MALKLNWLVLILLATCFHNAANAQRSFSTTIQFPGNWETKKISLQYDDGIQKQEVHDSIVNNKILIRGTSFSKYITLDILYLNERGQSIFINNYFLKYGTSSIKFTDSMINIQKSTFGHCILINATQVQNSSAQKKEKEFIKKEANESV